MSANKGSFIALCLVSSLVRKCSITKEKQPTYNTVMSVCISGNCICKLNNEQQSVPMEILLLLGKHGKGNGRQVYFTYKTIVS